MSTRTLKLSNLARDSLPKDSDVESNVSSPPPSGDFSFIEIDSPPNITDNVTNSPCASLGINSDDSVKDPDYLPTEVEQESPNASLIFPSSSYVNSTTEDSIAKSFNGNEARPCSSNNAYVGVLDYNEINADIVIAADNVGKKKNVRKVQRKVDFCYYCEEDVKNFGGHILRNHSPETDVLRVTSAVNSKERKQLISQIRKKGNYLKNVNGYFKPVRSLLPCSNCFGFYSSKLLYRHRKKCLENSNENNAQAEAQSLLSNTRKRSIERQLQDQVFPRMRPDKISLEAKMDNLLCAFGARYLKIHREKHFVQVTSRKMRELAKVLIIIKRLEPSVSNLFEALQPRFFHLFVESAKEIAGYDSVQNLYKAPTFAMYISTSFKQCCEIAPTLYLTTQIPSTTTANKEVDLKNMIHLFNSNWRFEVSSQAGNDLNIKKWNKVTIVSLASDLKKLKLFLIEKAKSATATLKTDPNSNKAYMTLLETIYCRVVLLNRKRPGELQGILLNTYLNFGTNNRNNYAEFDSIISDTEKILLKSFKRVVIRGKRGRRVTVLFSEDVQDNIKSLLEVRCNLVCKENPYLFGTPGLLGPITGYKVLEKYARLSGAKNPSAITCTKLRKHLATLSQLFSLKNSEVDQLTTFMGHTLGVHKNNYRLPDDIHQTAKLSKVLLLMEGGNLREYKGKTFDEIDVGLEEDLLKNENENDHIHDKEAEDNYMNTDILTSAIIVPVGAHERQNEGNKLECRQIEKGKKNTRTMDSRTEEHSKKFFAEHIKNEKPPKQSECQYLIQQNGDLLANKDWKKIKVFIQNIYYKNKSD